MSYAQDCTVAICTRDSGALLERAVKSAVGQARVLIVDDYSSDGSVERVRSAYPQVQVIRPCVKKGLGNARHTAVSAVETEWLIWLDADDEFLPGRVETLLESVRASAADIVFDAAELWDGKTGRFVSVSEIPPFMFHRKGIFSLFSRNWLPGSAWPLVRTSIARSVGYNKDLMAAEDLDFNLRAVLSGHHIYCTKKVGYKQYHYSDSLSRNLDQQNQQVSRVLRGVDDHSLIRMLMAEKFCPAQSSVIMGSFYLRRDETEASTRCFFHHELDINNLDSLGHDIFYVIGIDAWDTLFFRGVLSAISGDFNIALRYFRYINNNVSRPEVLNNIGVCHSQLNMHEIARYYYSLALEKMPWYLDAQLNSHTSDEFRLTRFPMRRISGRSTYS
jgi:glycosyltransferase involved in cell wall biosynthesis